MTDVLCYRCGMPTEEPKLLKVDEEQQFVCMDCWWLCAACDGSGETNGAPCKFCKGTGIGGESEDDDYFGW